MTSSDHVILLTATIDPGLYSGRVRRASPQERLRDYLEALNFWIRLPDTRITGIVFCENSGASIETLEQAAMSSKIPIEFLSFTGNTKPVGVHYGYSELGIVDYAVRESTIIHTHKHFIKATGRLMFPRITELLNRIDAHYDCIVDHRLKYRREGGCHFRARTQLMFFAKGFYERYLLDSRDEMIGSCSHIEEFLAQKLDLMKSNPQVKRRFPIECPPMGLPGSRSDSYQSAAILCKNFARGLIRRVYPAWWL